MNEWGNKRNNHTIQASTSCNGTQKSVYVTVIIGSSDPDAGANERLIRFRFILGIVISASRFAKSTP